MGEFYTGRPRSRRPFIVTPYVVGPDGELVPRVPTCCPLARGHEEAGCRIRVLDRRRRKTGPRHRLYVVGCRTHGTAFTLYPPGFGPYRRQSVLRLSPGGGPLQDEGGGLGAFSGTLFEAAVDASKGRAWARESGGGLPERWWGTQGRHLLLCSALVGVTTELSDSVREGIAAVLSVGTLVLRERSVARGYRALGRAVCDVLERMRTGARRALRLLVCGHLIGQWGEPLSWDAERGVLERSPFCAAGTLASG